MKQQYVGFLVVMLLVGHGIAMHHGLGGGAARPTSSIGAGGGSVGAGSGGGGGSAGAGSGGGGREDPDPRETALRGRAAKQLRKRRNKGSSDESSSEDEEVALLKRQLEELKMRKKMAKSSSSAETASVCSADPAVASTAAPASDVGDTVASTAAAASEAGDTDLKTSGKAARERARKERRRAEKASGALHVKLPAEKTDPVPRPGEGKDSASASAATPPAAPAARPDPVPRPGEGKGLAAALPEAVEGVPPAKIRDFIGLELESQGPSWIQCGICRKWARSFKFMKNVKVVEQREVFRGDQDDVVSYLSTCIMCLSAADNITVGEAYQAIVSQRTRWDRERSTTFRENKERLVNEFHFVGSNRQLHILCRSRLVDLFSPWSSFILAKVQQIELSGELLDKLSGTMATVADLISKVAAKGKAGLVEHEAEIDRHLSLVEDLHVQISAASERLAFKDKGELANSYQMASEFQDGWVEGPHGRFRSWYVCSCGCVMSSKAWKRRYEAHDAVRQRYYCLACGRKYRVRMGQVIEIYYPHGRHHLLGPRGDPPGCS